MSDDRPSDTMPVFGDLTAQGRLRGSLCGFCFLAVFACAFFHQPVFSGKTFHVWDHSIIYVPMHVYNARLRAEGEIPLWNRHNVLGYPTQAETELSGVYLPSLVFNLISDPGRAYTAYILAHVLLASAGMMSLASVAGAGPLGQTAAGLVFVFGGSYIGQNYTLTLLTTMSWAPLILALQLRAMESARLRYAVLAGVALAVQTSGAHPQGSAYTLLMMLAVSLSSGVNWASLRLAVKVLGVSLLVGFGLSAPQVFYLMEAMSTCTQRWQGMSYEMQVEGSPHPLYLLQLIVPDFLGQGHDPKLYSIFGEKRVYCGLLALSLLLIGWNAPGRLTRLFQVIFVAGLVLALGRYCGLYRVLYVLPGIRSLHLPARLFLVASLGAAVLIGLGLDRIVSGSVNWRTLGRRIACANGVLAGLLAAVGLGVWLSQGENELVQFYDRTVKLGLGASPSIHLPSADAGERMVNFAAAALKGSVLAALGCIFGVVVLKLRRPWILGTIAVAIMSVDLFVVNVSACLYGPRDFYNTVPDSVAQLQQSPGLWRMVALSSHFDYVEPDLSELPQNVPALYGIDAVQCNLGAPRDDVLHFFGDIFRPLASLKEFGLLNVRYLLLDAELPELEPHERWRRGTWRMYELPDWQPRVALRSTVLPVRNMDESRAAIRSGPFDPEHCVTLQEAPVYIDGDPAESPPEESSLEVRSYAAQHIVVEAVTAEDSILVLADLHHPGWVATSNGRPVPILRANGLTRGVALGPGRHQIEFTYQPRSFYLGLAVSALTLFVLAICGVTAWVRTPVGREEDPWSTSDDRAVGAPDADDEMSRDHRQQPRTTPA